MPSTMLPRRTLPDDDDVLLLDDDEEEDFDDEELGVFGCDDVGCWVVPLLWGAFPVVVDTSRSPPTMLSTMLPKRILPDDDDVLLLDDEEEDFDDVGRCVVPLLWGLFTLVVGTETYHWA